MKLINFSFKKSEVWAKDPKKTPNKRKPVDTFLLLLVLALSLFGLLMVYNSSVVIALRDFSDPYHFVRDQGLWLAVGLAMFVVFARIDYHWWYKLALPILIGTLFALGLVFAPGLGVKLLGAHRWINLGFFTIQPAELAKLSIIIYLASWFTTPEKNRFWSFFLLLAMVVSLVVAEPDLGTAVILFSIALMLYFFSGAPVWHFLAIIPIALIAVLSLAVISPYRMARLTSFLNPETDPLGNSYQIRQATLALGSGGWWGVGLGKSRQKYEYLPEANTDSIFAIVGEETGFVGAASLVLAFLLLLWRGFGIARRATDKLGYLLALGITSWIGLQFSVNVAANVAILPLTGVPLPLISYGGSSLIVVLAGLGVLLNISRQ